MAEKKNAEERVDIRQFIRELIIPQYLENFLG